jgi:hypothetical protein
LDSTTFEMRDRDRLDAEIVHGSRVRQQVDDE